jgi:hypothetical protein
VKSSPTLVDVLLAELDDGALDVLAERLAPRLASRLMPAQPEADRWLDSQAAASYLGITKNALHKHTSARTIPFEQDSPGGKLWFKPCELDAWRRGERFHA